MTASRWLGRWRGDEGPVPERRIGSLPVQTDGSLTLSLRPHEVATVRLRLATGPAQARGA